MPTRIETQTRRNELAEELRKLCEQDLCGLQVPLPTVRDLATRFQVSRQVAAQVVQSLESEGLLHSIRGVGTFVGARKLSVKLPFLYIRSAHEWIDDDREGYRAFSEELGRVGARTLSLTMPLTLALIREGKLPLCAGICAPNRNFDSGERLSVAPGIPLVGFKGHVDTDVSDCVSFDDEAGGRQATLYMHEHEHRSIGYVGLHQDLKSSTFWSVARANGWRQALSALGLEANREILPADETAPVFEIAFEAVQKYLALPPTTGLVFATDALAHSFYRVLQDQGIPATMWPAAIGFDDVPGEDGQILCSMRLPRAEIGAEQAKLLWSRVTKTLTGPPIGRVVPMRLIPRMSSIVGWGHALPSSLSLYLSSSSEAVKS